MRYLIAVFCPPLAILLCGKLFTAIASGVLWLFCLPLVFAAGLGLVGWLVLMAHAWIVISNHKATISRVRTGRLFAAIAVVCFASSASAAEMTIEKAQRFVELEAQSDAEQIEIRQEIVAGLDRKSRHAKDHLRTIRELQSGTKHSAPILESKAVGSIGAVPCSDPRGYKVSGSPHEMLQLDPYFVALGSSDDNGRNFTNQEFRGYGVFYVRNYQPDRVKGNIRYRPKPGDIFEVVGRHHDGLPILEPFDADAARKLMNARPSLQKSTARIRNQ